MFGIDINPFDGDGFSVGGKSASEIARGIGNFATNQLLGVDDFRRAVGAARSGNYGRALMSLGTGAFELGSTFIPVARGAKIAAAGLRAGQGARILAPAVRTALFADPASEFAFRGVSRLAPGFAAARPGVTRFATGLLIPGGIAERAVGTTLYNAINRGEAAPTTPYASTSPTTYSNRPTGTPDAIERRQNAAAAGTPAATTTATAAAPAGATTAPGKPAAVPAGGLAANDPAVQAALDAERIAAEEELQNYVNQLALARVRGSAAEEAALREAARASAGGAVDVAGMFGESGLGYSPATLMSALEQLRGQEAAARRGILGERTGRISEAGRMEESARRAYERALQGIRAREIAGRTGQTISMIQPYLGGA